METKKVQYPLKEFNFAFIYNKVTNYFSFDKLNKYLNDLEKETSCKITCHYIEINSLETSLPTLNNISMVTCEPKEISYLIQFLKYFPDISWVHSMFSGVDKFVQTQEILSPSITLTNARGAYSDPLAEYTILSMLYFNYNIPNYLTSMENKCWTKLTNEMIDKKSILIIGYGKNGIAIAKRVKFAFNMRVIAIVRQYRDNIEGKEFTDEIYGFEDFVEKGNTIIKEADFILATLPDTKQSKNFFNKEFFEKMKNDAIFINIGRGSAVVENDLIEALDKNVIRGAVLDVCQHEPLDKEDKLYCVKREKLLITNHCGDFTTKYIDQSYKPLIDNIRKFIQEGKLVTVVRKDLGY